MWTKIFAFLPIIFLIFLMVKKRSMPSYRALPLSALVLYFIALIIFKYNPNQVHATVIYGLLVAWTPILIIAGAIFLFRTMDAVGGLAVIKAWLNNISENKVAQLMIVGWAFPFLIEGASGFGTPAAIAAPVLVGLGFPPVRVAILTLIMNSVPVSFGAVGTPTWFGFSGIDISIAETMEIGFKTATIHSLAALIIPAIALSFVIKAKYIFKNWQYILLSVLSTVLPYFIVARFNFEFPSLVGGTIGLVASVIFAKLGIGLSPNIIEVKERISNNGLEIMPSDQNKTKVNLNSLLKASFPLWGTLIVLIITRIPQLGIKGLLSLNEPSFQVNLGSVGIFSISPALVISLKNIFLTNISWNHSILYVPSILPFLLVSVITFLLYPRFNENFRNVLKDTILQMKNPTYALLGALVFVNLMMMGGEKSAVTQIGSTLADITGNSWKYFASYLGALGSFFSGSNTVSNLTFGGIQDSISASLGFNRTTILALQSVGGAMGNMICINNIVAVSSVLALGNIEGYILKRTFRVVLIYGIIAAIIALFMP